MTTEVRLLLELVLNLACWALVGYFTWLWRLSRADGAGREWLQGQRSQHLIAGALAPFISDLRPPGS